MVKTIKISKEFREAVQNTVDDYFCEHLDIPYWLDTWVDKMIDTIFEVRE